MTEQASTTPNLNEMSSERRVQMDTQMRAYMQMHPHVIHGTAIATNGVNDLNEIYFALQDAYPLMLRELKDNKVIADTTGEVSENFMMYGFPRFIPNLTSIDYVCMYIERHVEPAYSWGMRIVFHYKGDSVIIYTSQIVA